MTLFEVSIIVMAVSTVAQAISTMVRNAATMKQMNEAKRIVTDLHGRVGAGAEIGALVGATIEAFVKPQSKKRIEQLEATVEAQRKISEQLTNALDLARRTLEATQPRESLALKVVRQVRRRLLALFAKKA